LETLAGKIDPRPPSFDMALARKVGNQTVEEAVAADWTDTRPVIVHG
jgi:hypothetical protein